MNGFVDRKEKISSDGEARMMLHEKKGFFRVKGRVRWRGRRKT